MSSTRLVLTPFPDNKLLDIKKYEIYEHDFIPQQDVPYFIYHDIYGGYPNGHPTDLKNKNLIKHIFGFAKSMKGNFSISETHKNNVNKDDKDTKFDKTFTNKRTIEINQMYENLSIMILKLLHNITWNTYYIEYDADGKTVKSNKYVLSSLDWEEFIPLIKKIVDIYELVNTKVINDKYNVKYSSIEVEQAVEKVKLETDQMIGKKMNKK